MFSRLRQRVVVKSFSEVLILESQYDERFSLNSPKNTRLQHVKTITKKQFLYTTCCELVFFTEFNEQSLVTLWVN